MEHWLVVTACLGVVLLLWAFLSDSPLSDQLAPWIVWGCLIFGVFTVLGLGIENWLDDSGHASLNHIYRHAQNPRAE